MFISELVQLGKEYFPDCDVFWNYGRWGYRVLIQGTGKKPEQIIVTRKMMRIMTKHILTQAFNAIESQVYG